MLDFMIPLWGIFIGEMWQTYFLPVLLLSFVATVPVIIRKVVKGY